MTVFLVLLASTLLYSKSKYSPVFLSQALSNALQDKSTIRRVSYSLFIISLVAFIWQLGFWTGLTVYIVTWMLSMNLVVFIFPINRRLPYIICTLTLLLIVIENSI